MLSDRDDGVGSISDVNGNKEREKAMFPATYLGILL